MDSIRILGGKPLRGSIRIGGAKNASLPLMAASIMTDEPLILENIPDLADITSMAILLEHLGVEISQQQSPEGNAQFCLNLGSRTKTVAPYDLVRKMRASILVLGPLLARLGEATVSLPGGCAIGTRPVDLHIRALQELGAEISLEEGYICAKAPKGLVGATITFPKITVTGTENILMAACLAKGETRLINAAREPEVVDLANCLIKMGAKIEGVGTDTLIIEGVDSLHGAHHTVVPDRIETGTFMMAAAMTYGQVDLLNSRLDLLPNVTSLLQQAGVEILEIPNGMRVSAERIIGTDLITEPFPGFPTDLQAQFMALMTVSEGASLINETIFENRFMHVPELQRLGANISVYGSSAMVRGVPHLIGAPVMATDLRASGSLVMAGLAAHGETIINRVYHLDRGYEYMEDKLAACGADIERIKGKGEARVTEEWSAVA